MTPQVGEPIWRASSPAERETQQPRRVVQSAPLHDRSRQMMHWEPAFSSSHQYVIKSDEESSRQPTHRSHEFGPGRKPPRTRRTSAFLHRGLASCKGTSRTEPKTEARFSSSYRSLFLLSSDHTAYPSPLRPSGPYRRPKTHSLDSKSSLTRESALSTQHKAIVTILRLLITMATYKPVLSIAQQLAPRNAPLRVIKSSSLYVSQPRVAVRKQKFTPSTRRLRAPYSPVYFHTGRHERVIC